MSALILATFFALSTSQEARPSVQEVLKEQGPAIRALEGVVDVAVGGTAEDPRIMVRVSSEEAKAAVSQKIGAQAGGYKFYIYVARPAGQTVVAPASSTETAKP